MYYLRLLGVDIFSRHGDNVTRAVDTKDTLLISLHAYVRAA